METQNRNDIREVMAWLHGGELTPNPEMEDRFLDAIADRVMVRMGVKVSEEETAKQQEATRRRERRRQGLPHPLSIKTLMAQIEQEEAQNVDVVPSVPLVAESTMRDNVSEDLPWEKESESHELDSVVVAKALQWMASMHDIHLNGSQIQSILYNAYGVWLATKGERLLSEHPQVWQYGPVFPRAYKHLKKNVGTGEVEYDMLQADHPSEFIFVTKCFQRFAWTSAAALSYPHTASGSPWKRSLDANPEKLGSRIDDELIREWFLPRV